jgi:hypothetical protein
MFFELIIVLTRVCYLLTDGVDSLFSVRRISSSLAEDLAGALVFDGCLTLASLVVGFLMKLLLPGSNGFLKGYVAFFTSSCRDGVSLNE